MTLDTVKLNRTQLLERRLEKITQIDRLVERILQQPNQKLRSAAIELVMEETAPSTEFSFTARAAVNVLLKNVAGIQGPAGDGLMTALT